MIKQGNSHLIDRMAQHTMSGGKDMANPLSNKKKIRGWKKRIRDVNRWKKHAMTLNVEELMDREFVFEKLYIDPWYRLVKRNPPPWLRHYMVEAMMEVFNSWHQLLNTTGNPYYLAIWLFVPDFMSSQVVAAVGDRICYYQTLFDENDEEKSFKADFFGNIALSDSVTWILGNHATDYLQTDLDEYLALGLLSRTGIEKLISKAYAKSTVEICGSSDTLYRVKIGHVWIGTNRQE